MASTPTLAQVAAQVAQLLALFDADAKGVPLTAKVTTLPKASAQYLADLSAALKQAANGDSSAGTPAPAPSPVVTGVGVELLPAAFRTPFQLTGTDTKAYPIDALQGTSYAVKIEVASVDGGGVGVVFKDPSNGSGFGYQKLIKGTNTLTIAVPITGMRLFTVAANGGNSSITSVSLTKV